MCTNIVTITFLHLHTPCNAHLPDPCSRQDNTLASLDDELSPASRLLINAAAKLHGGKKPLDVYDKYDFDSVLTHSLGKLYKCIRY